MSSLSGEVKPKALVRKEMNACLRLRASLLHSVPVALLVGGSMTADAQGNSARSEVVGHVYVNDNTAPSNTIGAFDRHANGNLTPMSGSPFPTGGAGAGGIVGSQGALQVTSDGRFLLAADAGSHQISVLAIASNGTLQPAPGSPVDSGGIEPISIAVHNDLVYVANEGNGTTGSNYTGFTLSPTGVLTPLADSTFGLAPTAAPGDILFNSTGTNLVGVEVGPANGPSFIDSFSVGADGRLTAAPGSPFPSQAVGPFGSEFRPTNPSELYVSNAHGGANAGSVSAFDVAQSGVLKSIGSSPFPTNRPRRAGSKLRTTGSSSSPSIRPYRRSRAIGSCQTARCLCSAVRYSTIRADSARLTLGWIPRARRCTSSTPDLPG